MTKAAKIEYGMARKFLVLARAAAAAGKLGYRDEFLKFARAARENARKHRKGGV